MEFKKILVPYDDSINSRRALSKAFVLASVTGSTITLVHVIAYHKAIAKIVEPYKETMIGHVKKFLNDVKIDAKRKDVKTEEKILYGNPSEEIISLMKKKKFDLVIMVEEVPPRLQVLRLGVFQMHLFNSLKFQS